MEGTEAEPRPQLTARGLDKQERGAGLRAERSAEQAEQAEAVRVRGLLPGAERAEGTQTQVGLHPGAAPASADGLGAGQAESPGESPQVHARGDHVRVLR